ncbi:MAG TPA: hypothetical protein PK887_03000 [Ignavibacteriales bacterium]|nr:hypothetical protein [Ignavibacteriales bacterium]
MDDLRKKIEEIKKAATQVYIDKTAEILREKKQELIQERLREERARKDPRDVIFEKINELAKKGEWQEIIIIYQNEKPGFIKEHALKSVSTAANNVLEKYKNNLQLDMLVKVEISQFINDEVKKNAVGIINQIYEKAINNYKNSKETENLEEVLKSNIKEVKNLAGKTLIEIYSSDQKYYVDLLKLSNNSRLFGDISFWAGKKLLEIVYLENAGTIDPDFIVRFKKEFNYSQFQTFFYHLIDSDVKKLIDKHKETI